MKTNPRINALACLVVLWGASPGFSKPSQTLALAPESALWLVGDSTLHPFTSRTTTLTLSSEVDADAPAGAVEAVLQKGALHQLRLVIPVQSLKSKESGLDKNMYKALKSDQFPEIIFILSKYSVSASTAAIDRLQIMANGTLTIAGHEQPIVVGMDASRNDGGVHVTGEYTLLMTDYGIKPPTMMMGTIKVKNPVVIHFDLHIGVQSMG